MIDTPMTLYRQWEQSGCYKDLTACLRAKQEGTVEWADYCYLPIAASMQTLMERGVPQQEASAMASELMACWLWGKDKTIYRFDSDLAQMLAEQAESSLEDTIPSEFLLRLPHYCQFVQTDALQGYCGFFVFVEYDLARKEAELRFNLFDGTKTYPFILHILPDKTTGECIAAAYTGDGIDLVANPIATCLQLLLYILSADADVKRDPASSAARAKGKKVSKQERNKTPDVMDVGIRIGRSIRMASADAESDAKSHNGHPGSSAPRRSHARRGHWHHYWTGSREEKKLILKWTAPTFVHSGGTVGTTVIPVKPPKKKGGKQ